MTFLEMAFVGCAITGFIAFAVALAWVAHVDYTRLPKPNPQGGDE